MYRLFVASHGCPLSKLLDTSTQKSSILYQTETLINLVTEQQTDIGTNQPSLICLYTFKYLNISCFDSLLHNTYIYLFSEIISNDLTSSLIEKRILNIKNYFHFRFKKPQHLKSNQLVWW